MKLHAVACIAAASLISVAPAQDPAAAAPAGAPPVPAHADNAPPAPGHDNGETLWPQEAALDGDAYVLYSPQFESIEGSTVKARVAFRRTPKGAQPVYGSARFSAAIDNDLAAGLVVVSDILLEKASMSDGSDPAPVAAALQRMLMGVTFTVPRSVALEGVQVNAAQSKSGPVSNAPPAIRVVDHAATLLLLDGPPVLRMAAAGVGIAQNTPSLLAFDSAGGTWFTRLGTDTWLHSTRWKGPFIGGKMPTDEVRKAIEASVPARHPGVVAPAAAKDLPEVVVCTVPTVLVSIAGQPDLAQVADGLMAVRNANADLFTTAQGDQWWLLASGRWFTATDLLNGPWTSAAPSTLPAAFAQIDPRGTWGNVLAAVPGTDAAKDALYQQAVPHVATISRALAKASVGTVPAGSPAKAAPIAGTSLTWVTNATRPVIGCDGAWYLCQDAAWFKGSSANGPWSLCDAVPAAIYGIPASSPLYGTTFVQVVNSTADAITFSYTAGYVNGFALDGVAVYGTGSATPGTSVAVDAGAGDPGDGAIWGEYVGWPMTYGTQPNFGYAGWMYEPVPGWAEDTLECAPLWGCPGWWGPDQSFGLAYALGMGYAGSWHWGYHPWGARDGAGWWTNHWGAAYRRGWAGAMTAGNRAAAGGDLAAARALAPAATSKTWGHAGGIDDDVSANAAGTVVQQRDDHAYARGADGWRRDDAAGKDAPSRSQPTDDFRPDPNHNFDGSPRGAFARGETNYADRDEGLEPGHGGQAPGERSRGGNWNGGGFDRPAYAMREAPQQQQQQAQPQQQRPNGLYGYGNPGWSNGQRGYGQLSGYTGARGVVRPQYGGGGDGYSAFEGGGISSGYSGGIGQVNNSRGLQSGYTGGLGENNGSTGLRSGYSGGLEGNGMSPGVRSGYSGGGAGLNYSLWGYGMVGGGVPQYTWMGFPGMYGATAPNAYGGYRTGPRGGMRMR